MSVPAVNDVRACVNTPVVIPPSAKQFVIGLTVVPQQVPLAVSAAPPSDVTLAPSVAELEVIALEVGVVTVGTTTATAKFAVIDLLALMLITHCVGMGLLAQPAAQLEKV